MILHRILEHGQTLVADGHSCREGPIAYRGQITGILLIAFPSHHGRDDLSAGAFPQQLQGPVRLHPAVEEVTFPMGISPPFIKFIDLGDQNLACLESLHGRQNDVAGVGVKEVEADGFGPPAQGFPQPVSLKTANHGSGKTIHHQGAGEDLHRAEVTGDQDDSLAFLQGGLKMFSPLKMDLGFQELSIAWGNWNNRRTTSRGNGRRSL